MRQTECFFLQKRLQLSVQKTRASYQRGCLGTEERITAEGCSGPEALNKTETLAAGAGGHQHAAQKASRHPSGFPGLPQAGICKYPFTDGANLRKSHLNMSWWLSQPRHSFVKHHFL